MASWRETRDLQPSAFAALPLPIAHRPLLTNRLLPLAYRLAGIYIPDELSYIAEVVFLGVFGGWDGGLVEGQEWEFLRTVWVGVKSIGRFFCFVLSDGRLLRDET